MRKTVLHSPVLWWSASRARRRPASVVSGRYACCRCACEIRPSCPCSCWIDTSDELRQLWHRWRKLHVHHHRSHRCDSARCPCLLLCARARLFAPANCGWKFSMLTRTAARLPRAVRRDEECIAMIHSSV